MTGNDKYHSPYRGFWIIMLLLILIPFGLYKLMCALFEEYSNFGPQLNEASARCLGCGMGSLFHLSFLISGVFTSSWRDVKYRVSEFFENLVVGVGYAFKTYWEDIREDGINFDLAFSVMIINFLIVLDALRDALLMMGYI